VTDDGADHSAADDLRERRRDRRFTLWVALISVVPVTIVSLVGILLTDHAADNTNKAFDKRTQRDFLHQQRVTAFADFLGAANDLAAAEARALDYWATPRSPSQGFPPQVAEIAQQLPAKFTALQRARGAVELVAAHEVNAAAARVVSDQERMVGDFANYLTCVAPDPPQPNCEIPAIRDYRDRVPSLTADTTRYVTAGRSEIGSPP
jgi:hypothetical protein